MRCQSGANTKHSHVKQVLPLPDVCSKMLCFSAFAAPPLLPPQQHPQLHIPGCVWLSAHSFHLPIKYLRDSVASEHPLKDSFLHRVKASYIMERDKKRNAGVYLHSLEDCACASSLSLYGTYIYAIFIRRTPNDI